MKRVYNLRMKILLSLLSFSLMVVTNAHGTTANCSGGICEFSNSYHYKNAKTYCLETLSYEDVKTDFLYFIILKNGQKCDVYESQKNN